MDRQNNFDLIRLVAALQVAFLHSCGAFGVQLGGLRHFLELFSGVPIFFFMSGLMVTSSAMRRPLKDYAEARVRRILPALWLAFALALIVLIAFGQVGAREAEGSTFWLWTASQLTIFQVFNPDMFRDFGVGVVNGSLWTIPVETTFYMVLPVLLFASRRNRRALTALFVCGGAITFVIGYFAGLYQEQVFFAKLVYVTLFAHFWLFALGALAYLYLDDIKPLIPRVKWWMPIAVYVAFAYLVQPVLPGLVGAAIAAVMLCGCTLWAGMGAPVVAGVLRGNDISYGLYVYHMLVVNSILALGYTGAGPVGATLAISIAIALLSWNFLERVVLRRALRPPITLVA